MCGRFFLLPLAGLHRLRGCPPQLRTEALFEIAKAIGSRSGPILRDPPFKIMGRLSVYDYEVFDG